MKTNDVVKKVRKHVGPVFITLETRNEAIYIQCVRSDLIKQIVTLNDGEIYWHEHGDMLFIDKACHN